MSNWIKLKTQIKNLDSLKEACKELNILYEKRGETGIVAVIKDNQEGGPQYSRSANICKIDNYYVIEGDTHVKYSSLAARLGADYGLLIQAYAKHEVLSNVTQMGGMLTEPKLKEDGSLVLRVYL